MDIFILDSLYRRNQLVDRFQSLIWTERFSSAGDFELQLHSTFDNRSKFTEGTKLAINESRRVMQIETVQDGLDDEGREILKVTGTSLESVLSNRLALSAMGNTTTHPSWTLTGTPKAIATQMFHDICVTGILDPGDVIPLVNEGSIFPVDTIGAPIDVIEYVIDPKTLYEALKDLCDLYLMGFRLVRNFDLSQLWFDVYMGSDRTSHQTTYPAVIFSPGLDNLKNPTELRSTAAYKNVAYVVSPVGSQVVYAAGADPSVNGFERRALLVNASDITDTDPVVAAAAMVQRGYQELAKNRQISAFDGEISQYSNYIYGTHYNLGDMVEMRNTDGFSNSMQVTEQIIVSDENGDRSYPTLSLLQFVTPGSWAAQPAGKQWYDFTIEHWADMPG
jgi:Siphovirus ReqiPepy6 Gp37-like protein